MVCTHIKDLKYLSLPVEDADDVDLLGAVRDSQALQFIDQALAAGGSHSARRVLLVVFMQRPRNLNCHYAVAARG